METVPVAIVGAGPAGLVVGLSLAQNGVRSVILEKELEVGDDPRGVYLAADAVRILYSLGLGKYMSTIGHELYEVQFHQSSFARPPFHTIDLAHDKLAQAAPNGILQIQPELEKALRKEVEQSSLCELRIGCDVQLLEQQEESVSVHYKDSTRSSKQLQARWLIGADGKRGVVRKMFLEKVADIRQVETAYRYEGTWVAANLKLRAPTPETHPDFPLWKLGMTPSEVYDLFWPKGWHFCAPPGKPTASGRFGPYESGYWRHEYRQDGWDPKTMDAEKMFWEHLIPMVTRTSGRDNIPFPSGAVTFPRDCIDIVRCRPFTFSHKVVNRWFSGRTILIGDAAHVFPPFGGQGIASGVRDAHQLAWRIALMDGMPNLKAPVRERLLESWACERTKSVAAAATITWINGLLANTYLPPLVWAFWLLHWLVNTLSLKFLDYDPQITQEQLGFSNVSGGTFLSRYRGGLKLPQIYIDTLFEKQTPSDALLASDKSIFKLFILVPEDPAPATKVGDIEALLAASEIPKHVLSSASISIVSLGLARPDSLGHYSETHKHKAAPSPLSQISPRLVRKGYSIHAFKERFGPRARFIIARPDSYVFAVANNLQELRYCLDGLKKTCEGTR